MFIGSVQGLKTLSLKNDIIYPNFKKKIQDSETVQYNYSESKRVPYRIQFYHPYNDHYECFNEGDEVYELFQGENITCTKDDIIDPQSKAKFLDTIDNLRNFMERLVKVDQFYDEISLYNNSELLLFAPSNYSKSHLFVQVTSRACMEGVAGYGGALFIDDTDERPTQGLINICPSVFVDSDVDMFGVLFHELVHVMGFGCNFFESWLNRETGKRWGSDFPISTYTDPKYPNKNFTILHTPQSHAYASKRWNTKEFAPGIPMGIELEDGGGDGTKGSHPDIKIAFGEVMAGVVSSRMIISDMILSLIEDMGWYSVDFSLAKPFKWGDYASIGMTPPPNVFREPPQKVFPKHYFCEKDDADICSFDFKSHGFCHAQTLVCPGTDDIEIAYCSEQSYYNPNNLSYSGFSMYEFMPIVIDERISNTNNNFCFKATPVSLNYSKTLMKPVICNKEKTSYTVSIFGDSYLCDNDDREYNLTGRYSSFKCSPPKIICEGIEYDKRTFSQPNRVPFPNDKVENNDSSSNNSNSSATGWIITCVVGVIAVLAFIFVFLKNGNRDESSNNDNQI